MTVGPIEGVTSAIGDEIDLFSGLRSTRVRTKTVAGAVVDSGLESATTVDGVNITFASPLVDTAVVVPGTVFRIMNDAFVIQDLTRVRRAGLDPSNPSSLQTNRATVPELLKRIEVISDPVFSETTTETAKAPDVGLRVPLAGFATDLTFTAGFSATLTSARAQFDDNLVGRRIILFQTPTLANSGTAEITGYIDENTITITRPAAAGAFTTESGTIPWEIEGVRQGDSLRGGTVALDSRIASFDTFNRARFDLVEDVPFFEEETMTVETSFREAIVLSATTTTITLLGAGLGTTGAGVAFTTKSWQVATQPDYVIDVETTLDWADQGEVFVDGVRYHYDTTAATFDQLQGVGSFQAGEFVNGVQQQHVLRREVVDFTRIYSELDRVRRSFLVEHATGADLNAIGDRLALSRPDDLPAEEVYREALKAIGYGPRGTEYVLERFLDAVVGPDAYTIYEDLTTKESLNHGATVFFLRLNTDEDFVGKTYLSGDELVPMTSATTVQADATLPTVSVRGITYADEPAPFVPFRTDPYARVTHNGSRLVSFGSTRLSSEASSTDGFTVSFAGAPANIANVKVGDVFEIIYGHVINDGREANESLSGARGTIRDITNLTASVEMGPLVGASMYTWPESELDSGGNISLDPTNTLRVVLSAGSFAPTIGTTADHLITFIISTKNAAGRVISRQTRTSRIDYVEPSGTGLVMIDPQPALAVLSANTTVTWRVIEDFRIIAGTKKRAAFSRVDWKIWRPVGNYRYYEPNEEVILEYEGDTGTQLWGFNGTSTDSIPTPGEYLELRENAINGLTTYRHYLRMLPTGEFSCSMTLSADITTIREDDQDQFGVRVFDGAKDFGFTLSLDAATKPYIRARITTFETPIADIRYVNKSALGDITFQTSFLANGDTTVLTDARGRSVTFEYRDDSSPSAGNALVDLSVVGFAGAAGDIADAFRVALDIEAAASRLDIAVTSADAAGTAQVFMRQRWPSVAGNTQIVDSKGLTVVDFTSGTGALANQGRMISGEWKTYQLVKSLNPYGEAAISLFENGTLVDQVFYRDLFDRPAVEPRLEIGCFKGKGFAIKATGYVKEFDWSTHTPDDLWNIRQRETTGNNTTAPDILEASSATFVAGDATEPRRVRILEARDVNPYEGNAIGEWEIYEVTSAIEVKVRGPIKQRASNNLANRAVAGRDVVTFQGDLPITWPHNLGCSIEIDPLSTGHPNKGIYRIEEILEPGSLASYADGSNTVVNRLGISLAPPVHVSPSDEVIRPQRTNVVRVDTSSRATGFFDGEANEVAWRLIPNFPTTISNILPFNLVDIGTEAAGLLDVTRAPFPLATQTYTDPVVGWTPLLSVGRTEVLSAQVLDSLARNTDPFASPPVTEETYYPFYLWDAWGWIRRFLDKALLAAGIRADFDRLVKDGAGFHILDRLNPP